MAIVIAVDFDGTIVEHRFPSVGKPIPGAFRWLKKFQKAGAKLILWTMRSDGRAPNTVHGGDYLADAVNFCKAHGIEFWAHNANPEQLSWTGSPKAYAQIYIDDAALGCPLKPDSSGERDMVNWRIAGPRVMKMLKGDAR